MEKKILFAVAVERAKRLTSRGIPNWDISISYLHAKDIHEARFLYKAGNTQELVNFEIYCTTGQANFPMKKMINVAAAVGHFVDNEKTGQLSAE